SSRATTSRCWLAAASTPSSTTRSSPRPSPKRSSAGAADYNRPMAQPSNREIVEEFVRAIEAKDIDAQCALLADDFVDEMPQSGERTRGRENYRGIFENYPGGIGTTTPEGRRIIGSEDRWIITPAFNSLRIEGSGDT